MSIDVAEQLFPNILTVITQLCATGVLFLFVKKFLWSTARNMIQKRADLMQSRLSDAAKMRDEAEQNKVLSEQQLKEVQSKARDIVEVARKEASNEKDRILAEANAQASAVLEKAQTTIAQQKEEMHKDLQKEIVDVALAASAKLMAKSDLEQQDRDSLESFVKEIQNESGC